MSQWLFAHEKLDLAVRDLAIGARPLRERLRHDYRDHLRLLFKPDRHFPDPEIRGQFLILQEELHPEAQLDFWGEDDLTRIARELFELARLVEHRCLT